MKRILCMSLTILLTQSAYAAELPGDNAAGKRLVDADCMRCHNTDVYSSKDRKVRSMEALKEQLNNCSHAAGKSYSEIEMQDIVKYLNGNFYHF